VAAAKFGTTEPIDDPVREQQVLDSVATMSKTLSIDPVFSVQFFRDQIEANKVVQRGLYREWEAHQERRPTYRPSLSTEVRPQLDVITSQILEQLQATDSVRHPKYVCFVFPLGSGLCTEIRRHLDALHRDALTVALRSVYSPSRVIDR
jgi:chorismate mutase